MAESQWFGSSENDATSWAEIGEVLSSAAVAAGEGIVAGASAIGAGVISAKDFLKKVWNASDVNMHKVAIVGGALLNGTNAVTNIHRFGAIGNALTNAVAVLGSATDLLTSAGASGMSIANSVYEELNAVLDELKNPNIEGIPIHADKEVESQDIEVAQNLLIQENVGNKDYTIDNAVPKLKTWQISGYLMANPYTNPLDGHLMIKPGLVMQRKVLQWYIDSRMPVVFKTHDNRFFRVLITHMDTSYNVQALNALSINLTLTEFVVYSVGASSLSLILAEAGSASTE